MNLTNYLLTTLCHFQYVQLKYNDKITIEDKKTIEELFNDLLKQLNEYEKMEQEYQETPVFEEDDLKKKRLWKL